MTLTLFKSNIKTDYTEHFETLDFTKRLMTSSFGDLLYIYCFLFLRKEGINEVRRTLEKSNRQTD